MKSRVEENLDRAMDLSRAMLALADEGDRDRIDDTCGLLYGILREMGYKLQRMAQEESTRHRTRDRW